MIHYCRACERLFNGQRQLQQHFDSPAHDFYCEDCDRVFGTRHAIDQHMNSTIHAPLQAVGGGGEGSRTNKTAGGRVCFDFEDRGTCSYGSSCKYSHEKGPIEGSFKSPYGPERGSEDRRPESSSQPVDHIDSFFAAHSSFNYDASLPIWTEFHRMCRIFRWDADEFKMRDARRDFKAAMVQQFNSLYGTDEHNLASWQNLCHVLGIKPVPTDLKQCREKVRQTHVNLVDLVDAPRTKEGVRIFSNLKQLQEYTIENGKFFPKEDAKAGGLLKFLLREIINFK